MTQRVAGKYCWAIRLLPLRTDNKVQSQQSESRERCSTAAKHNKKKTLFMSALQAEARHASRMQSLRTLAQLLVAAVAAVASALTIVSLWK